MVYGVPDPEWGERVEAALVTWPGREVDIGELRERLTQELAPPQVPRAIRIVQDLPRTATGKVRRTGLADAVGSDE